MVFKTSILLTSTVYIDGLFILGFLENLTVQYHQSFRDILQHKLHARRTMNGGGVMDFVFRGRTFTLVGHLLKRLSGRF